MQVILNQVIVLFLIMITGMIMSKAGIINKEVRVKLADTLMLVCTPLLMLSSFQIDYSPELMRNILWCSLAAAVSLGASYGVGLLIFRKKEDAHRKVMVYASTFSNCGYMGMPLMGSLFGAEGVIYASVYTMVYQAYLFTIGMQIMGGKEEMSVKKILTQPAIIAVFLGILLFVLRLKLPKPVGDFMASVGGMTAPLSMIIIGSLISEIKLKDMLDWEVMQICAVRLILLPFLVYIPMKLMGVTGLLMIAAVLLVGTPVGANTAVFASKFDVAPHFAGKSVVTSTLLSLVTLTGWLLFLTA